MFKLNLKGRYKVSLYDKDTGELKNEKVYNNLITNAGIDKLLTRLTDANVSGFIIPNLVDNVLYCSLGNGVTPPTKEDFTIENHIAERSTYTVGNITGYVNPVDPNDNWVEMEMVYRFNTNTVGKFTEVTVGPVSGSRVDIPQLSRALFTDDDGNIETIDVTAKEALVITYILRLTMEVTSNPIELEYINASGETTTTTVQIRPINTLEFLKSIFRGGIRLGGAFWYATGGVYNPLIYTDHITPVELPAPGNYILSRFSQLSTSGTLGGGVSTFMTPYVAGSKTKTINFRVTSRNSYGSHRAYVSDIIILTGSKETLTDTTVLSKSGFLITFTPQLNIRAADYWGFSVELTLSND